MEEMNCSSKYMKRALSIVVFGFYIICCLANNGLIASMVASIVLLFVVLYTGNWKVYKPHTPYFFWVVSFWGIVVISHSLNPQLSFGWRSIVLYLLPGFTLCIFFSYFKSTSMLLELMEKGSIYGCAVLIAFVLINDGRAMFSGAMLRIGNSASGNVNTVAMYLCYFITVIYYLIVYKSRKKLTGLFIIACGVLLLTGSKKGVVGIVLIVSLMSIYKYKFRAWKYILIVLSIVVAYYLIRNNQLFYQAIGRRIDNFLLDLVSSNNNNSTGKRITMYELGFQYFLQSPIWGNGYGYFAANSPFGVYSHSNYVEILVSFGILGVISYYSLYIQLLVKSLSNLKDGYSILFFTFIVVQLFFDTAAVSFYDNPFIYVLLYITVRYYYSPEN